MHTPQQTDLFSVIEYEDRVRQCLAIIETYMVSYAVCSECGGPLSCDEAIEEINQLVDHGYVSLSRIREMWNEVISPATEMPCVHRLLFPAESPVE